MLLLWLARDNYHLAFLGLVEVSVFEQHWQKLALYCRELACADSTLTRLKLMVCHRLIVFGQLEKSNFLILLLRRNTWTLTAGWQKLYAIW